MADIDATNPGTDAPREEGATDAATNTGYVDRGGPVDDDSGSGGLGGIDAGSPGGMGGSRASGGTGNGNPPGGISPVQIEEATQTDGEDEEQG